MNQSEVARLRSQIETELEAMQRGLTGVAIGAARHDFIRRRLDRVGLYQGKLAQQVGEDRATQIVYSIYVAAID